MHEHKHDKKSTMFEQKRWPFPFNSTMCTFDHWYELVCDTKIWMQTITMTLHLLAFLRVCVCTRWMVCTRVSLHMLNFSELINHWKKKLEIGSAMTQRQKNPFYITNCNTLKIAFSPERNNRNDIKSMNHRWWFHSRIIKISALLDAKCWKRKITVNRTVKHSRLHIQHSSS